MTTIRIKKNYLLTVGAVSLGLTILNPYPILDSIVGGFIGTLIANRVWPHSLRNQVIFGLAVGAFTTCFSFWVFSAARLIVGFKITNSYLSLNLEGLLAFMGLVLWSLVGILFCKLAIWIQGSTDMSLGCCIDMPNRENPYQTPADSGRLLINNRVDWKQFGWLNFAIATALGVLILASFLWSRYQWYRLEQQLGSRYVSYDHEYHFYPINGLIFVATVFAIPNIVLLIIQFRRRILANR